MLKRLTDGAQRSVTQWKNSRVWIMFKTLTGGSRLSASKQNEAVSYRWI